MINIPFTNPVHMSDPDALGVPVGFLTQPLPALHEPAEQPVCQGQALCDHEMLVPVQHEGVQVLSAYRNAGWHHACPQTTMRSGIALSLGRVADELPSGFGLAVLDAWRPLSLQQEIYDATYADTSLPPGFVTVPSDDPSTPPPHLTGAAVDVTLTWDGYPLALGTPFDSFTSDARADAYEERQGKVRSLRRLLYWAMRDQGFVVLDCEWWHFEKGTRRASALTGQPVLYGAAAA